MEKQNRAERRRNKFGGGRASEHGGWPTIQPNPVFTEHEAPAEPEPEPSSAGAKRTGTPKAKAKAAAHVPAAEASEVLETPAD
jgi:hypothetical protein